MYSLYIIVDTYQNDAQVVQYSIHIHSFVCWPTILPIVITTNGIAFYLFAMISWNMNHDTLY